ncbi:MAG: helix-turn-helix domain-containing protein [Chloroflexia bacterium]
MTKPLNTYREERYMSIDEFTQFLGISLHTYYKITRGERPRLTTMRRIAEKLQVPPPEIAEFVLAPNPTNGRTAP